jgi:UDP-glucose 4-epimerase
LLVRGPVSTGNSIETAIIDMESPGTIDPSVLEGCEAVIHLAARIPTHHNDIDEALLCWRANALGTMKLVDAMSSAGVKRLIQTTSANAYAPWVQRPDELAPMFPTSRIFYLASKIAQELYANARGMEHGIGITTLRVSSVYGTASHRAPITLIARQMLDGSTVRLVARGEFGADFVTDEDVAQALFLVLETAAQGPFNVASGTRSTLREIAQRLAELTGTPEERILLANPSKGADRGFPAIDNRKLVTLGFCPTPLDQGLEALINALRDAVD